MMDSTPDLGIDNRGAQNAELFQEVVRFISRAETRKEMEEASVIFIFDLMYPRGDIALALHKVERAKGWR